MAQLQQLVAGLFFVSESDAPLEVVSCPRPEGTLPSPTLLETLGEPATAPVQVVELGYFLRNHTAPAGVLGDKELAARYQVLQDFMQQFGQVQVYRVGNEPQVHAYALGEVEGNLLAGFKTVLIET
jgi:histidine triad (HIT) family protein